MKEHIILQAGGSDGTSPQLIPNPPQRILVVEDDPLIRQINSEVLICDGYHVDAAEDGADAWDTLQLNNYDLLVTDHKMPKVSGIELLKKLYAAHITLPVIMATGTLPAWELSVCPWLQPAAILLKPYTMAELLGTVKNVLCAPAIASEEIAPSANWSSGQPTIGLRL